MLTLVNGFNPIHILFRGIIEKSPIAAYNRYGYFIVKTAIPWPFWPENGHMAERPKEKLRAILEFMASNGLVANPTKTTFLMLNHRGEEEKLKVEIGGCKIEQEGMAKLLGMKINDDMNWSSHIKGLVSALNQRTSVLRRMKNHLNDERLKKIIDSIWTSKLRYGLQLCASVRTTEEQMRTGEMKMIQKAQNRRFSKIAISN